MAGDSLEGVSTGVLEGSDRGESMFDGLLGFGLELGLGLGLGLLALESGVLGDPRCSTRGPWGGLVLSILILDFASCIFW